jgi:type IV pilus assembly protein PilA
MGKTAEGQDKCNRMMYLVAWFCAMIGTEVAPTFATSKTEWPRPYMGGEHLMKRSRNGFSLIELLIVVAIILIIAAIAIPNLLRARMQANEASAVSSIHAVNTASISYSTLFPTVGFAPSLLALGDGGAPPCAGTSAAACYLDPNLEAGTKSGYTFTYTGDTADTPSLYYTLTADPISRGTSGQRGFYSSNVNVTRFNPTGTATSASSPLQ